MINNFFELKQFIEKNNEVLDASMHEKLNEFLKKETSDLDFLDSLFFNEKRHINNLIKDHIKLINKMKEYLDQYSNRKKRNDYNVYTQKTNKEHYGFISINTKEIVISITYEGKIYKCSELRDLQRRIKKKLVQLNNSYSSLMNIKSEFNETKDLEKYEQNILNFKNSFNNFFKS